MPIQGVWECTHLPKQMHQERALLVKPSLERPMWKLKLTLVLDCLSLSYLLSMFLKLAMPTDEFRRQPSDSVIGFARQDFLMLSLIAHIICFSIYVCQRFRPAVWLIVTPRLRSDVKSHV